MNRERGNPEQPHLERPDFSFDGNSLRMNCKASDIARYADQLELDRDALRSMLREVEWVYHENSKDTKLCQFCFRRAFFHAETCRLAALIKEEK